MKIDLDKLPVYMIAGHLSQRQDLTSTYIDLWRKQIYQNEYERIGLTDNVIEQPAIFEPHPGCGQHGLTIANSKIWEDIVINKIAYAMINEDDVLFHDNFRSLWDEYVAEVDRDFLYVNVGGRLRGNNSRVKDNIQDKLVHNEPTWCMHAYIISYEGAMSLLQHYYSIINMPIFMKLKHPTELKSDLCWENWHRRLTTADKKRTYSFNSTPKTPAMWNGYEWYSDKHRLKDKICEKYPAASCIKRLRFCPSVGLAYQARTINRETMELTTDFHLRKNNSLDGI